MFGMKKNMKMYFWRPRDPEGFDLEHVDQIDMFLELTKDVTPRLVP